MTSATFDSKSSRNLASNGTLKRTITHNNVKKNLYIYPFIYTLIFFYAKQLMMK